jgi:hypothetical protein
MVNKKCKMEKDVADGTWEEYLTSIDELVETEKLRDKACLDEDNYCNPSIFEGLSGENLKTAVRVCEVATRGCTHAIRDVEEADKKNDKINEKWKKASKALSDCEHKKKRKK